MRDGIRQRLVDAVPGIGGRVLESHEDGAATDKPYLVLIQGEDVGVNDWAGFSREFEVWPYQPTAAGFSAVDELGEAVVQALDGHTLTDAETGEVFTCKYGGTVGSDRTDAERDALTRGLRFLVAAADPAEQTDAAPADEWLTALAAWTSAALGADSGWSVYGGKWPQGYQLPAVLWRVSAMETADGNAAAIRVRKMVFGHVLGRTPNEQSNAIALLAERLKQDGKIVLNAASRQYLTVRECAVMAEADALRTGQLMVTLTRRTIRPDAAAADEAPLMREVLFNSNMS